MDPYNKINNEHTLYIVFAAVLIIFMLFDLGVFHRKDKEVTFREALLQTIMWIAISFAFNYLVFLYVGKEEAYEFLAAYITEKSLSIDNIFVFVIILNYFAVDKRFYHKILVWGVLGAVIFRAIFIFLGGFLVEEFHWILYIFGAILIYTGFKLFFTNEEEEFDPEKNVIYKFLKNKFRFSPDKDSGKIVIRENGKIHFTVLFLVIVVIESTDIIFALDSVPAVFAISQDTFVIYTSNIFAVMGLRAMFFLLRSVVGKFRYLQHGISLVLIFIGAKMLAEIFNYKFPTSLSLLVILLFLTISIFLSAFIKPKESSTKNNDSDQPE